MAQLPSQSQFGDYGEWPGRDVLDSGGERLGGVREIYLDRETGRPEWVLVDVGGDESRFVPLADASVEASTIRVAHSAAAIRNAPGIGVEQRIDQSAERRLYDHYGIGYHDAGSGLPADEPTREHERPADGPTPTASDTAAYRQPDPEPSSWSAAAEDEPSNLAPPPAGDPPPPEELEAADIPEPPAVTDRASELDAEPLAPAALGPDSPNGLTTPSGGGEILSTGAGEPEALAPAPEPEALPPGPSAPEALAPGSSTEPVESDLTAQHGPDVVGVFSSPPAPEAQPPRAFTPPPPQPEPESGSALDVLKTRRGGMTAGVALAAVLFFIVRKLR
jgi:PRC-barrel domain protein